MTETSKDLLIRKVAEAMTEVSLSADAVQRISTKLIHSNIIDDSLFREVTADAEVPHLVLVVLAGIISDSQESGDTVPLLFSFVEDHFTELSPFDQGIYWHLKGHSQWRDNRSLYQALFCLNNGIDHLIASRNSLADPYRSRVYDSLGQVSYGMGYLQDALIDFEMAINLRPEEEDTYGKAITYGNLGRTHMDLGNWEEAIRFFLSDLEIMQERFAELTRIQSQLLSHLGYCYLENENLSAATAHYHKGWDVAQKDENHIGQIFSGVGLGKIAVSNNELEEAMHWNNLTQQLVKEHVPAESQIHFSGYISHLSGLISAAKGDLHEAKQAFAEARRLYKSSNHVSPIEMVRLLTDFSQVSELLGDDVATAELLEETLIKLDSTTAVAKRMEVEAQLKERFRDRWILHTSRRLSGNKSFEALLEKTGQEGFSVEKNDVAVMFADIRGFTNISEGMDPQELVSLLNGYLSSMIRAVNMHGGYVVQVLGDAVMAVFTLPEDDRDEADRAAIAALIMVEENRKLNNRHAGRYPALRIGVGIHFGEVVTGLIGSALKRSYTLIGDVVNTASRIEGLTKILDVPILVTEEVGNAMEAKDQHLLMPMGKFVPYGREEPVSVYALLGLVGNNAASKKDAHCIKRAHEALTCFEARKFAQASKLYLELHKVTEISGFQYLAAQADHFQNKPPAKDWSGAIELQTK